MRTWASAWDEAWGDSWGIGLAVEAGIGITAPVDFVMLQHHSSHFAPSPRKVVPFPGARKRDESELREMIAIYSQWRMAA